MCVYIWTSDIDECALDTDGCDQGCINTPESFMCNCSEGYLLDEDGYTCNGENKLEWVSLKLYYFIFQILMSVHWALMDVIKAVSTYLEVSCVTALRAIFWMKMGTLVMVRINSSGFLLSFITLSSRY